MVFGRNRVHSAVRASGDGLLEDIYGMAVARQVVRVADILEEIDGMPENVEKALESLVNLGLLQASLDGDAYHPVSPQAALARTVAPITAEIERSQRQYQVAQSRFARFLAVHDEAIRQVDRCDDVQILMGTQLINEEIERTVRQARQEVLAAQPGGGRSSGALDAAWRDTAQILSRGVRMRMLYNHSARFSVATRQYAERVIAAGAEARTVVGSFQRLIIVDRDVAFVPAQDDREVSVMVQFPEVVHYLAADYEQVWETGVPFGAGQVSAAEQDERKAEIRKEIIRLLALGLTDEAVASRVGLGVRSCRAHIAKIYEEYGARSRFHLGILIAESGLLKEEADGGAGSLT
jgi:DNA-binding CsgD family transcriptional regulator